MSNVRLLDPSPATLLSLDHRWIRELFRLHAETPDSDPNRKQALFEELRREIRRHYRIVAQHLSPIIEMSCPALQSDLEGPEELLQAEARPASGRLTAFSFMSLLEEAFERHVRSEEQVCFPILEQLPPALQRDLSLGILRTRDDAVKMRSAVS